MSRHAQRLTGLPFFLVAAALLLAAPLAAMAAPAVPAATPTAAALSKEEALAQDVTQGALRVVKPGGEVVECPLKHTDVKADISGFIARVKVTQTFPNPLDEKIEAVYVFPLPHQAAVDDMTMVIGERRIVGLIKRRAEARSIYEQALAAGKTAALLEQERPNIFTQSVGNIGPSRRSRSRSPTSMCWSTTWARTSSTSRWSSGRGTSPAAQRPRFRPCRRNSKARWANSTRPRSSRVRAPPGHRLGPRHDPRAGCLAHHAAGP